MPPFGPISRDRLIAYLRRIGFDGPYAGGKHQYVVRDRLRVRLPSPHGGDIGRELLARILRQAGVSRDDWGTLLPCARRILAMPASSPTRGTIDASRRDRWRRRRAARSGRAVSLERPGGRRARPSLSFGTCEWSGNDGYPPGRAAGTGAGAPRSVPPTAHVWTGLPGTAGGRCGDGAANRRRGGARGDRRVQPGPAVSQAGRCLALDDRRLLRGTVRRCPGPHPIPDVPLGRIIEHIIVHVNTLRDDIRAIRSRPGARG